MDTKLKLTLFGAAGAAIIVFIIGFLVLNGRDSQISDIHKGHLTEEAVVNKTLECQFNKGEIHYRDPVTGEERCDVYPNFCGENMVLVETEQNGTKTKVCQCDVNKFARPLIYHEISKQCYFIFTKGYCSEGEWLTVEKDTGPKCEPRLCHEPEEHGVSELVPLKDGRCVELGKHDVITCKGSAQVVRFFKRYVLPSCTPPRSKRGKGRTVFVRSYKCPVGYFSTNEGHCQPDFDFD